LRIEPLTAQHDVSQFDCGEESLNKYIKFAVQARQMNLASTFVCVEDETDRVLGYYARVMNSISAESVGNPGGVKRPVPVMLLAQFATATDAQRQGVGKKLLRHLFERVIHLTEEGEACFGVILDALNQSAKDYYLQFGFKECIDNPSRLYLPLKLVRRAARPK
jgi:GNAT superfamily N-acetyltransferase